MTAQQLSHFRSALMCLFDRATGKPSPFASNVLLSPCYFRLGSIAAPASHPPTHSLPVADNADSSPARHSIQSPQARQRHSIPIAPASCERLSPTAF
jgi:hypothetical protein